MSASSQSKGQTLKNQFFPYYCVHLFQFRKYSNILINDFVTVTDINDCIVLSYEFINFLIFLMNYGRQIAYYTGPTGY